VRGPGAVAESAARDLRAEAPVWWLHTDLDVLSTEALAAVDYPQPGGLSWDQLTEVTIAALRVGDPREPDTDVGPLIAPAARDDAEDRLQAALDRGARLVARSGAPAGDQPMLGSGAPAGAALFAPALLAGLSTDDPLRTHELFAPVLTVEPFATPEEAWRLANASPFGLSAAVYGRDPALLGAAGERIEAGVIALNRRGDAVELEAPFGGRKRSGNGAPEGGEYVYGAVTALQAVYG